MIKVLLISPRSPFLDSDRVFPCLGILYLKGVLDANDIYSVIEDGFDFERTEKYDEFDYFLISFTTPQRMEAEKIRKLFPDKKIVVGGPHASFYSNDCLGIYNQIVVDNGEKAILKILNGNKADIFNDQMTTEEMNVMPLPHRSDFLHNYHYELNGIKTTTIITSRGCPYMCAFCEHAGRKVRYYGPGRIRQELIQVTELGFGAVMFFDDLFAINQKRVEELCGIIKDFKIKFRCFAHVRQMTYKMAQTLAMAGCLEVGVGMESGSQKILDIVKIPTTNVKQNYEFVKICHSCGIRVKAFFMLGLPGETQDTILETEKLIATSGIDDFDLVIFNPYKGTKIMDNITKYDLVLNNCSSDGYSCLGFYKGIEGSTEGLVHTSSLSAQQIKAERDRIFHTYKKQHP